MKRQMSLSMVWVGLGVMLLALVVALPAQGAPLDATTTPTAGCLVAAAPILGHVVNPELYVRVAPSLTGTPLLKLLNGDVIEVLGQDNNGDWLQVQTNVGIVGWASSPFIQVGKSDLAKVPKLGAIPSLISTSTSPTLTPSPTGTATPAPSGCLPTLTPAPLDGQVVGDVLTVRDQPVGTAKTVGSLKRGDKVKVIAFNAAETWIKIGFNGSEGWASSAFVLVDKALQPKIPHDYASAEQTLTPTAQN